MSTYRLEGTVIKTEGDAVRITLGNGATEITPSLPSEEDVVAMLMRLRGDGLMPNHANLRACSFAAQDAARSN